MSSCTQHAIDTVKEERDESQQLAEVFFLSCMKDEEFLCIKIAEKYHPKERTEYGHPLLPVEDKFLHSWQVSESIFNTFYKVFLLYRHDILKFNLFAKDID